MSTIHPDIVRQVRSSADRVHTVMTREQFVHTYGKGTDIGEFAGRAYDSAVLAAAHPAAQEYPVTVAGASLTREQDAGGIAAVGRFMSDAEILAWCRRRWLEQGYAGASEKWDHEVRWAEFEASLIRREA